jgi:hypothetical protein
MHKVTGSNSKNNETGTKPFYKHQHLNNSFKSVTALSNLKTQNITVVCNKLNNI